jgi:hypothetical protein
MRPSWKDRESWNPTHQKSWFLDMLPKGNNKGRKTDVMEGLGLKQHDLDILRDNFIEFLKKHDVYDAIVSARPQAMFVKNQRSIQTTAWLPGAPCRRLCHKCIPEEFQLMAAGVIWDKVLDYIRDRNGRNMKKEHDGVTPALPTPSSRRSESTPSFNTNIGPMMNIEQLPVSQSSIALGRAVLTLRDGATGDTLRSIPLISILKGQFKTALNNGTLYETDIQSRMLSCTVLEDKIAARLGSSYANDTTTLWDYVYNSPITDDDDLQSTVLRQLEANRLTAVYVEIRQSAPPKRRKIMGFNGPLQESRHEDTPGEDINEIGDQESSSEGKSITEVISDSEDESDDDEYIPKRPHQQSLGSKNSKRKSGFEGFALNAVRPGHGRVIISKELKITFLNDDNATAGHKLNRGKQKPDAIDRRRRQRNGGVR